MRAIVVWLEQLWSSLPRLQPERRVATPVIGLY